MGVSARIRQIFSGSDRSVLVRVHMDSVEGKAYCKESEVGGYISEMMKLSTGNMQVTIYANPGS